ncbi:hypothetical protein [Streptomyces sp. NBC_00385]|uniref:hypothetical protein n=1 Tax=Streptomyces sp. NBC_00385 TaxID=2975733 RepID=UPI002DDB77F5|nr:hypothetical protein [Streptomyces sp. NBC_00385]WRZ04502.1 hypothetical protein OG959_14580 [Streptomyces sp. NBC_00385]
MSEEIRDEGRAQGRAQGQADSLLLVLDVRGIALTEAARKKITACTDTQLLHQWLVRAATATTAEEVFAEDPEDPQGH